VRVRARAARAKERKGLERRAARAFAAGCVCARGGGDVAAGSMVVARRGSGSGGRVRRVWRRNRCAARRRHQRPVAPRRSLCPPCRLRGSRFCAPALRHNCSAITRYCTPAPRLPSN
jgi:hypothetical protein